MYITVLQITVHTFLIPVFSCKCHFVMAMCLLIKCIAVTISWLIYHRHLPDSNQLPDTSETWINLQRIMFSTSCLIIKSYYSFTASHFTVYKSQRITWEMSGDSMQTTMINAFKFQQQYEWEYDLTSSEWAKSIFAFQPGNVT